MRECGICFVETDEIRHFEIYVTGSEGIWLCLNCQIFLSHFLSDMRTATIRTKQKFGKKKYTGVTVKMGNTDLSVAACEIHAFTRQEDAENHYCGVNARENEKK